MITKIMGEAPFQVLTNNFSISPSNEGYTLQISADGKNYSNLFQVGANVTRLVTGVAANSYYRLLGNNSEVSINWMKTCVTEGGGSGSGVTPEEVQAQIDSALTVYTPTANFATINGSAITSGGNITIEGGDMTVLKSYAGADLPEDAELGDVISFTNTNMPTFYGDNSDTVTSKMHIDLSILDTASTYNNVAFFFINGQQYYGVLEYDANEEVWNLNFYSDWEHTTLYDSFSIIEDTNKSFEVEDGKYVSIGYLEDDYSDLGGMMLQMGLTEGTFGMWIGPVFSYGNLLEISIPGVPGIPYYEGIFVKKPNEWVNYIDEVYEFLAPEFNDLWTSFDNFTPTENFATINGSAITEGGNLVIEYEDKTLIDFDKTTQAERADLYTTLKALYDGGSGATINKTYDFYKTVGTKQGLKIDYYGFSGNTLIYGKVVSPDNPEDQVAYAQVMTIQSDGSVSVVSNVVGGVSAEDFNFISGRVQTNEEVVSEALNNLNERIVEISGNTIDLSDYYTSAQTESAITSKNYVTSAQVETQIVEKNYITSAATQDMVTSTSVSTIWKGTQQEYDAIATKDPATLYIIIE